MQSSEPSFSDARVLVVDDNAANVLLVERLLEWAGIENFKSISDSRLAIRAITDFRPDMLLLDLHMPFVDGYEILGQLQSMESLIGFMPILVFTADASEAAKNRALALGASDFLTKPGNPTEIMQRVKNFLRARRMHVALEGQNQSLEQKVRERTVELEEARLEMFESLARAAEFRDDETGEHTKRVGRVSHEIAVALGLDADEAELIGAAAQLHDIGKIGIPDNILLKPGKLSAEEIDVMRRHTEIGGSILRKSKAPLLKKAREIALNHHENWDGTGYPVGISGEKIPMCARIVAVADVYDALTHERPYKAAWTVAEAHLEIRRLAGTKFDQVVVEAFFKSRTQVEELPVAA